MNTLGNNEILKGLLNKNKSQEEQEELERYEEKY